MFRMSSKAMSYKIPFSLNMRNITIKKGVCMKSYFLNKIAKGSKGLLCILKGSDDDL